MKKIKSIFFLLFVFANNFAQSTDESAVRKVLNDQVLAWNKGDIDEFMKAYWQNDSLQFIGRAGLTYGYDVALKNYKKNYSDTAQMGKLAFTLISVKKLSNEYFFVTGKWRLIRSIGDIGGVYTLLFRKIESKWFIVSDHTSLINSSP